MKKTTVTMHIAIAAICLTMGIFLLVGPFLAPRVYAGKTARQSLQYYAIATFLVVIGIANIYSTIRKLRGSTTKPDTHNRQTSR